MENVGISPGPLARETPEDAERIFRIASVNHRKPVTSDVDDAIVVEGLSIMSGQWPVFSEEELRDFLETHGWLKAVEKSFEFWNNPDDAVYDSLSALVRRRICSLRSETIDDVLRELRSFFA